MFLSPYDFRDLQDPVNATPVGRAHLVRQYGLDVPVKSPAAISEKSVMNSPRLVDEWLVHDRRLSVEDDIKSQVTFVLKHETMDLLFFKRLFAAVGPAPFEEMVRDEPNGTISRKVWYLYEWLTGDRLDLEDSSSRVYVDLFDPRHYFTSKGTVSARHRLRDNALGTSAFCPVVRRTAALDDFVKSGWSDRARESVGRIHPAIVARAANFLLLADSQASYQIEGERPTRQRLERWMRVVEQAGRRPLSVAELERLQAIIVEGDRFIHAGLRREGGFIGGRDYDNNPMPEFVSARHEDVLDLVSGIISADDRMRGEGVDPVVQAAAIAFGFVFVHPFEDGNGRIHRYLMHHVLAETGFAPKGLTFPISSVLLDRQEEYADQLRRFSGPLLPYIDWRPTPRKNVEVLNETADLYRYGDYTELSEFLYRCVAYTIEHDLPKEIDYLKAYDRTKEEILSVIEMPDNTLSLLVNLVRQNGGTLSNRKRESEFSALTDDEVQMIEEIVRDAFSVHDDQDAKPAQTATFSP